MQDRKGILRFIFEQWKSENDVIFFFQLKKFLILIKYLEKLRLCVRERIFDTRNNDISTAFNGRVILKSSRGNQHISRNFF